MDGRIILKTERDDGEEYRFAYWHESLFFVPFPEIQSKLSSLFELQLIHKSLGGGGRQGFDSLRRHAAFCFLRFLRLFVSALLFSEIRFSQAFFFGQDYLFSLSYSVVTEAISSPTAYST